MQRAALHGGCQNDRKCDMVSHGFTRLWEILEKSFLLAAEGLATLHMISLEVLQLIHSLFPNQFLTIPTEFY